MNHHGSGEASFDDNLVIYEALGPFNYEGILSLRKDLVDLPPVKSDESWAVACKVLGESLYTPDAEEEHRTLLRDMAAAGLIAVSYCISEHISPRLFTAQIQRIYTGTGVALHILEDWQATIEKARQELELSAS